MEAENEVSDAFGEGGKPVGGAPLHVRAAPAACVVAQVQLPVGVDCEGVPLQLVPKDAEALVGFNWGYSGPGPARAADAILADALGLGDPWTCGFDSY
ncbi:DUF6166 domain-containing protein [Streptomyces sp. CC224B]|uniref:DUF6166 domain-containing protein n=1 Tax=Streptomyces sp. CC224B TaxID=3044571 RepID=UPI0024A98DFF|nr:DUF6166 domain-containing protein [Streptomyces sp. CC224B]